MTEQELLETLSQNIKSYRKGKFTQETLAEKIGVSAQNINNVEGKRRFLRTESRRRARRWSLPTFIPQNKTHIEIEESPENEKIRTQMTNEIVEDVRKILNKALDEIKHYQSAKGDTT